MLSGADSLTSQCNCHTSVPYCDQEMLDSLLLDIGSLMSGLLSQFFMVKGVFKEISLIQFYNLWIISLI